jgi:hypothetical protein
MLQDEDGPSDSGPSQTCAHGLLTADYLVAARQFYSLSACSASNVGLSRVVTEEMVIRLVKQIAR